MQKEFKSKKEILRDTQKHKIIYLKAGEVYHSKSPDIVHTVLGSCLSVILHYAPLKLSAICHAQISQKDNKGKLCYENCPVKCKTPVPDARDFKYVSCSLQYMLDLFKKNNIPTNKIAVKIFGGANVLPSNSDYKTVGEENIETALQFVKSHNLKITAKSIGGTKGRVLYLYSESGEVYVSEIKENNPYKLHV